jgi:hypothetical protein
MSGRTPRAHHQCFRRTSKIVKRPPFRLQLLPGCCIARFNGNDQLLYLVSGGNRTRIGAQIR